MRDKKNIKKKKNSANKDLVAYCGLYCGACGSYLKGRCPGCHQNQKATWCKIRVCCAEHEYASCADCKDFTEAMQCGKYNNFISKLFGLILRSDRAACIRQIKLMGIQDHANAMAKNKQHTIKKARIKG